LKTIKLLISIRLVIYLPRAPSLKCPWTGTAFTNQSVPSLCLAAPKSNWPWPPSASCPDPTPSAHSSALMAHPTLTKLTLWRIMEIPMLAAHTLPIKFNLPTDQNPNYHHLPVLKIYASLRHWLIFKKYTSMRIAIIC
jgi:hypothetical protein